MAFKDLFRRRRPMLTREEAQDPKRIVNFVRWFIKNDPLVKVVNNPSCNIMFGEGYRPLSGENNDPKDVNPSIETLTEWFFIKVVLDIGMLANVPREEFEMFIDILDEKSMETLMEAGETASKYDLNLEKGFVYQREIVKIPEGTERDWFKVNFLQDCILGAEIRILAWLYQGFFRQAYQIKERREGS